jgi:hypothetical protein
MHEIAHSSARAVAPHDGHPYDAPVEQPEHDLLGFVEYARGLCRVILERPKPLTIGVYGIWGEGKTSFVYLIRHALNALFNERPQEKPLWIDFSTWKYAGADEVWRALMLAIAAKVYGINQAGEGRSQADDTPPKTRAAWLRRALRDDAFMLYEPPKQRTLHDEYNELAEWLGSPAYETISKSTAGSRQQQLDPETLWPWFVNTTLSVASGLTGLLTGLGELLQGNTARRSESAERVRELERKVSLTAEEGQRRLEQLFKRIRAQQKPVFVFVDDLDRSAPDAALDVLDAIRVFFTEVENCTFIVAADETVLGQGLHMRHPGSTNLLSNRRGREFYEQKGREYLEKLVQFSVRVPPRDPRQSHCYIASQAARWTVATDIIQAAVGTNPRRLK